MASTAAPIVISFFFSIVVLAHSQCLTRAKASGAAVIRARATASGREQASIGQIVGMNELIKVVPLPQHWHVVALADPLKEDLENPEAPVAHDCARADYGHV